MAKELKKVYVTVKVILEYDPLQLGDDDPVGVWESQADYNFGDTEEVKVFDTEWISTD